MSTYNLWRVYINDTGAGVYNNTYQVVEQDAAPTSPYTFSAPISGPWILNTLQTSMVKSKLKSNTLTEKTPANGTYVESVNLKSLTHTIRTYGSINSGTFTSILGGNNTMSGYGSAIISGKNNNLLPNYCFIGSGKNNSILGGKYSCINSGKNNTLSSSSAVNSIFSGKNNIISGYTGSSIILGGNYNSISNSGLGGVYITILGGVNNNISINLSSFRLFISGSQNVINSANNLHSLSINGNNNSITGLPGLIYHSHILGGTKNSILNTTGFNMGYHVICGGVKNKISLNNSAVICGGCANTTSGVCSFIGGGGVYISPPSFGDGHIASGNFSVIAGGGGTLLAHKNQATGSKSIVVGGRGNISSGTGAFIGSGWYNSNASSYSIIGGGRNNIISSSGPYNGISGGYKNNIINTSNNSIICGGRNNIISGNFGVICGGIANTVSANCAFIGGGGVNTGTPVNGDGHLASGAYSVIAGGGGTVSGVHSNLASGICSVVVGGRGNTATNLFSLVGGGLYNSSNGINSSILGGKNNLISYGSYSSILGGYNNIISSSGNSNFIIGNNLTISGTVNNCVMFGTGLAAPTADEQFFSSQILNTTTASGTAVVVESTTGLITRTSSTIKIKKNIRPISNDIIDKLYELDPVIYNSKCEADDPNVDFYGLIAEYLESFFPEIVSYDKDGIPMSVQYLQFIAILIAEAKLRNKDIEIIQSQIDDIEKKYDDIEKQFDDMVVDNNLLLERIEKIETLLLV